MFNLSNSMPYMLKVRIPFNEAHVEFLRSLPGSFWDKQKRIWYVPKEWAPKLTAFFGVECEQGVRPDISIYSPETTRLDREYERAALTWLLQQRGAALLSFQMRMGKTVVALDFARVAGYRRILVIGPAMARPVWEAHAAKWYEDAHCYSFHETKAVTKKEDSERDRFFAGWMTAADTQPHILITSYGLTDKLEAQHDGACSLADLIIFDEIHELANTQIRRYQFITELVNLMNPRAFRLGLTGTIQRDEPSSLYGPLNALWPNRWGVFYSNQNPARSFTGHYCNVTFNGYGHDFGGVNKEHAEELKQRIAACSFTRLRTDPDARAYFTGGTFATLERPGPQSQREFSDLFEQAAANGEHSAFMFWLRESAAECYEQLREKSDNIALLDGSDTAEARSKKLALLDYSKPAAIVATIASTQTAIDLGRFTQAHYFEIAEQAAMMEQSVDRFALASGCVTFWHDKKNHAGMQRLGRKFAARAAVLRVGKSAEEMRQAFGQQSAFTQEEWNAAITDALGFTLDG